MGKLANRLPITQIKIVLARILYQIVHLVFRKDHRIITRDGIKYEVDLSEGIDLSLFLFGNYQTHVSQNRYLHLPKDATIFDVGANGGVMSLQFAKLVTLGKIYSFEPTFYAFSKLKKNLELNPELAGRIVAIQTFVSSNTSAETNIKAYASWKVAGQVTGDRHQVHKGIVKSTEEIGSVSLDDFCEKNRLQRLDFIKIDTDGHEFEVLKGAKKTISRFNPVIIFEIGQYVMNEKGINFSNYCKLFDSLHYSLHNSSNFKTIDEHNYREHIPLKGTIDILAVPTAGRSVK